VHANAPLTAEGRRRLVARVLEEGRPQAHVAAESRLARATVRKWVTRFLAGGEAALADRSTRPHGSPRQLDAGVVARIEALRRDRKLPPRLIVDELAADGIEVSAATVHRWLRRLGISRLRDLDITGNSHRQVRRIETDHAGQLVHVDVKKIGAIPTGGGWRVHGRGSAQDRAARKERVGYRYWHSAIDAHTRLSFTESLSDERAVTAAGFLHRATTFFGAHGITVERVLTDKGSCYRSHLFDRALPDGARHTFTRPHRPQTNGKVERYNRTLGAEFAYARPWTSETQRADYLQRWLIHYNYHRAHTAIANQPPATLTPTTVTNVMMQNT
jgi:transposase InsO family protein